MPPLADDLAALRKEMRAVDKALLAQVARRLKTAQRIGALKRKKGLPLRNYDVEADVIREARLLCKKYGIDQGLGEDVMRILIEAAVQAQEHVRTNHRRKRA